jgi:hypothetical protein
MQHKNNPWVSLVALLLLALILVLTCTGCTEASAKETEPAPRFTVENAGNGCKIITDTETGVQYLYFFCSYNGYKGGSGLCKLEG